MDELTDALLRSALRADVGRPFDTDVGGALRQVCDEARERNLRAEQMIVVLKSRWRQLPEARDASRDSADELFARVITLCIQEYYAQR